MQRVSALGGLFGAAAGGDIDADEPTIFDPFGLLGAKVFDRNARCSSQPTSDIMLALRKYGVTSRKNLTVSIVNEEKNRK